MRILSISDIHYQVKYNGNGLVVDYLKSFKAKIEELHNIVPIDIVFITGDLSFSGESEEFKELRKSIRTVLPESVPVYSVLGNHDVNWTYLKEAIGNNVPLENLYKITEDEIIEDLNKADSKYRKVFNEFRVNFSDEINKDINPIYQFKFCSNNYSGYIWCPDEKILFLLLNSSWYSFGPGVIEKYYEEKVKKLSHNELKEQLLDLIGNSLSQEGKQSYFLTSFPYFDEINKIIQAEDDVRVITMAHHPPSWLKWDEQYCSDKTKRNLNDLISLTDLFITGHLHSPVLPPSLLQARCYHLTNGSFLDYHFIDHQGSPVTPDSKFPNNWFNIIDINSDRFSYGSYKFITIKKSGKGISYDYLWELTTPIPTVEYEFYNYDPPKDTIAAKETGHVASAIKILHPKDLNHIISLLKEKRKNIFSLIEPTCSRIVSDSVNCLKFNGDYYLLIINNLEKMNEVLEKADSYNDLSKDNLFNSLLQNLNSYSSVQLPVMAFYDFLRPVKDIDSTLFTRHQNEKFILFQSFKHKFFFKFKELYKFTELNIVFDIIIE